MSGGPAAFDENYDGITLRHWRPSVNSCIMYGGWSADLLIVLYIAMSPHTTFCVFYTCHPILQPLTKINVNE